jgi:CBS domain-containing protein
MLKAKDIMKTDVITVSPETTVKELGKMFIEKGISGVPVVDSANKLYGIVTENDLIRQNKRLHIPTVLRIFDILIPLKGFKSIENEIRMMAASKVSEICSRNVITVDPETSLQDIATIMSEKKIHLLPVISNDELVGIIGKIDVIRASLYEAEK